jgi:hypothetical protein
MVVIGEGFLARLATNDVNRREDVRFFPVLPGQLTEGVDVTFTLCMLKIVVNSGSQSLIANSRPTGEMLRRLREVHLAEGSTASSRPPSS